MTETPSSRPAPLPQLVDPRPGLRRWILENAEDAATQAEILARQCDLEDDDGAIHSVGRLVAYVRQIQESALELRAAREGDKTVRGAA